MNIPPGIRGYLNENFKDIRKKSEDVLMEPDSQNMSKIESGLSLSREAESIEDYDSSRFQMIHAMSLLEEGLSIYRNINEQQREKLKDYATVEWKVLEEIRRCRKENASIQDTLDLFIDKMQKREVDIPVEVQELIDHLDYIDGYSLEIEAYKKRPVIFKKICDEISNKGAMEMN